MKSIKTLLVIIFSLATIIQAQSKTTVTQAYPVYQGDQIEFFTTGEMGKDSLGAKYSDSFSLIEYLPTNLYSNPIRMAYDAYSAKKDSIRISIEGLFTSGEQSSWKGIDTLTTAYNDKVRTLQFFKANLNNQVVEKIRIKVDGLTGNRKDTIVRVWTFLKKWWTPQQ